MRVLGEPGVACPSVCTACLYKNPQEADHRKRRLLSLLPTHETLIRSQTQEGYRTRVTLRAGLEQGQWKFGLTRRVDLKTLELIELPQCPVHHPRVNGVSQFLTQHLSPKMDLAWLLVSGAQVSLVVRDREPPPLGFDPEDLGELGVQGLHVNCFPSTGKKVTHPKGWVRLWGEPWSQDQDGLWYGPTSFRQVIPTQAARPLEVVSKFLQGKEVLDLYSGIGSSLRLWDRTMGIELGGEEVECARRNAPHAEVLRGAVEERLPQARNWVRRHSCKEAYVNPPRGGLGPEVCAWMNEQGFERLAYLSCNPRTLVHDLEQLRGYEVDRVLPYDFIPHTGLVEVLVMLIGQNRPGSHQSLCGRPPQGSCRSPR